MSSNNGMGLAGLALYLRLIRVCCHCPSPVPHQSDRANRTANVHNWVVNRQPTVRSGRWLSSSATAGGEWAIPATSFEPEK